MIFLYFVLRFPLIFYITKSYLILAFFIVFLFPFISCEKSIYSRLFNITTKIYSWQTYNLKTRNKIVWNFLI